MELVRSLKEEDFQVYADIVANAYPGWGYTTAEERQKMHEKLLKTQREDSAVSFYGLFRDEELLGGMRLHDYRMRLGADKVDAGGIGLVAVHLLHKKEKVAKGIVTYFIEHYRERKAPIALLYPFNPEFYKKMGFGFGTKMNQYRIMPKSLPKGGVKGNISFFKEEDKQLLLDCYARAAENINGMIDRTEAEFNRTLWAPENKIVVYRNNGLIEGYVMYAFRKASQDNALKNDIFLKELVYENTEAFRSLLTFLGTQEDQINRIIYNTLDEDFYHMLMDPKDGSDNLMCPVYHESNLQGVGLMYRVTDTRLLFESLKEHDFNGQSCKLRLNIKDSLIKENDGSLVIHFNNGRAAVVEDGEYEAEVNLDIADFSSLIVGAVGFKALLRYGIAAINDCKYADIVSRIFELPKPVCITTF